MVETSDMTRPGLLVTSLISDKRVSLQRVVPETSVIGGLSSDASSKVRFQVSDCEQSAEVVREYGTYDGPDFHNIAS